MEAKHVADKKTKGQCFKIITYPLYGTSQDIERFGWFYGEERYGLAKASYAITLQTACRTLAKKIEALKIVTPQQELQIPNSSEFVPGLNKISLLEYRLEKINYFDDAPEPG